MTRERISPFTHDPSCVEKENMKTITALGVTTLLIFAAVALMPGAAASGCTYKTIDTKVEKVTYGACVDENGDLDCGVSASGTINRVWAQCY